MTKDPCKRGARVKLCDFGVSHQPEQYTWENIFGTENYIAPEIYRSRLYSKKADVWSLGVILIWLITRTVSSDLQAFSFSKNLNRLLKKMLSKKPSKRPSINKILQCTWLRLNLK